VETAVEEVAGGEPVAWFPVALQTLQKSPVTDSRWAGAAGSHVYLLELEGAQRRPA
jgi:hypothetical protein